MTSARTPKRDETWYMNDDTRREAPLRCLDDESLDGDFYVFRESGYVVIRRLSDITPGPDPIPEYMPKEVFIKTLNGPPSACWSYVRSPRYPHVRYVQDDKAGLLLGTEV